MSRGFLPLIPTYLLALVILVLRASMVELVRTRFGYVKLGRYRLLEVDTEAVLCQYSCYA